MVARTSSRSPFPGTRLRAPQAFDDLLEGALAIAASATAKTLRRGRNAGVMFLPYQRQDGNSNATFGWVGGANRVVAVSRRRHDLRRDRSHRWDSAAARIHVVALHASGGVGALHRTERIRATPIQCSASIIRNFGAVFCLTGTKCPA
jgi:hypothetical protein